MKILQIVVGILIVGGLLLGLVFLEGHRINLEESQAKYEEKMIHVSIIKIDVRPGAINNGMVIYDPDGNRYSFSSRLNRTELIDIYSQIQEGRTYQFQTRTTPDLGGYRVEIMKLIGESSTSFMDGVGK